MNRNRKLRKQMMSGLAVGMAAVMGAAPVYAVFVFVVVVFF